MPKIKNVFLFHGLCLLVAYVTGILFRSMPEWLQLFPSYNIELIVINIGCLIGVVIVIKILNKRMVFQKGEFPVTIITGIVIYPLLAIVTDQIFQYFLYDYFFNTSQEMIMQARRLPLYFVFLPNERTIYSAVAIALVSVATIYIMQKINKRKRAVSI